MAGFGDFGEDRLQQVGGLFFLHAWGEKRREERFEAVVNVVCIELAAVEFVVGLELAAVPNFHASNAEVQRAARCF